MLRKVSIRNFQCLRDVKIDLERFTMFVGANDSGKSSILLALDFLCRAFREDTNLDPELLQSLSRAAETGVELAGEVGGHWYR